MKPLPKQQELIDSKKKITIYRAGDRSGKTIGLLFSLLKEARNKSRVFYVAQNEEVIEKVVIPFLYELTFLENRRESSNKFKINLRDGGYIEFRSSEGDWSKPLDKEIDNIYIDGNFEKELIEVCMESLICRNGRMSIAYTPFKPNPYLKDLEKLPECHLIRAFSLCAPTKYYKENEGKGRIDGSA